MAPAASVYNLRLLQVVSGQVVDIEKISGLKIIKSLLKSRDSQALEKKDFLCVKNRASQNIKKFAFLKTYVWPYSNLWESYVLSFLNFESFMQTRFFTQEGVWMKKKTIFSSELTSFTAIDVTPKRLKIAKFRLQILVDNSKSYSKRTYFFKIEEKMTKLWCCKVGSYQLILIFQLPRKWRLPRKSISRLNGFR